MCLNPTLIYNPVALRLWDKCSFAHTPNECYIPHGITFNQYACICGAYSNGEKISDPIEINRLVKTCSITVSGVRVPSFVSAPCGKCAVCLNKKRKEYRARLLFEASECADVVFFTLTYNDANLPSNGLERSDVSKFFKRFRINLQRYVMSALNMSYEEAVEFCKFRSFYCGEYGKTTKRAHYHGLLFFDRSLRGLYTKFMKIFNRSWALGFVHYEIPRNKAATVSYVSKYITKQTIEASPEGKTPCFVQGPSRAGGLGCRYPEKWKDIIIQSKSFAINVNVFGRLHRVKVPTTLLNKIFPQFGRSYYHVQEYLKLYDILKNEIITRLETDPFHKPSLDINHLLGTYDYQFQKCLYLRTFGRLSNKFNYPSVLSHVRALTDDDLYAHMRMVSDIVEQLPSQEMYILHYLDKNRWLDTVDIPEMSYKELIYANVNQYENYLKDIEKLALSHPI